METNVKIKLFLLSFALLIININIFAQGAVIGDKKPGNAAPATSTSQPVPTTQPGAQPAPTTPTAPDREKDHEELRALLRNARETVNAQNFDALKPLFAEKFSITTVDQKLFTNFDDFKKEFAALFTGNQAPLKSINFNPEADALTEFVGDNVGLSHGTSTDTYNFSDGDTRIMKSRWTATVIKENGKWKILNLHIGANILDNPVTDAAKSYVSKVGIGAGLGGLLIGFLVAWFLRGKK
ncbi:MAG: nuclear transport factor 2 family protein [Acidobacteriota bacterium]